MPSLELLSDSRDASRIEVQDCLIQILGIDPETRNECLPRFVRCIIGMIDGRVGSNDPPSDRFVDRDVLVLGETTATTAGIMSLRLSPGARVLSTVLKKLYLQRRAGRRENAFSRGLDPSSRRLVAAVLAEVERCGLARRAPMRLFELRDAPAGIEPAHTARESACLLREAPANDRHECFTPGVCQSVRQCARRSAGVHRGRSCDHEHLTHQPPPMPRRRPGSAGDRWRPDHSVEPKKVIGRVQAGAEFTRLTSSEYSPLLSCLLALPSVQRR